MPAKVGLALKVVGKARDDQRLAQIFGLRNAYRLTIQTRPASRAVSIAKLSIKTNVLTKRTKGTKGTFYLFRAFRVFRGLIYFLIIRSATARNSLTWSSQNVQLWPPGCSRYSCGIFPAT